MRDIRPDLRERLEIAEAEFRRLEALLHMAEDRMLSVKELLEAEEARIAADNTASSFNTASSLEALTARVMSNRVSSSTSGPAPFAPSAAPAIILDEFLLKAVRRGVGDKGELRDAAIQAGYFKSSANSPGRVVHARLTNLVREGQLAKDGERFVVGGH